MPILFPVNCERTNLFSVKHGLDHPPTALPSSKIFLEDIFSLTRKRFSKSQHKICVIMFLYIIFLKISFFLSVNHNPELQRVICTGVTLVVLVLHLNSALLSANQKRVIFFMYIINIIIPNKIMIMLLLQSLLITVFVVNCQLLMTRNCKSWLTGRFTGTLIPVERNQRMNEILYPLEHNTPRQNLKQNKGTWKPKRR